MSTWLYLECLDHDPPLTADSESGQHLSDLPQIWADLDKRLPELLLVLDIDGGSHFRKNTARFRQAHPHCHIVIRDEYGDLHPTSRDGAR